MSEVSARKTWWAYVAADLRRPMTILLMAVGVGVAIWQFTAGHVIGGFVVLAIVVLYLAHPGAAIGSRLGARDRRRQGS